MILTTALRWRKRSRRKLARKRVAMEVAMEFDRATTATTTIATTTSRLKKPNARASSLWQLAQKTMTKKKERAQSHGATDQRTFLLSLDIKQLYGVVMATSKDRLSRGTAAFAVAGSLARL